MAKTIILLNGPPRSGKDTAGHYLHTRYGFYREKFAQPIRDWACLFFGIADSEIEDLKHVEMLGGRTLRQWMISYSEDFLKKNGGPYIFGELLLNRLEPGNVGNTIGAIATKVAITDSGFREEGEVVVNHYGRENVHLIQIHRPGCSFKGDSRSYIELPGIEPIIIHNDGNIWDFKRKLMDAVAPLIQDPLAV